MYYYCTYFDKNYLFKGLALYQSLLRHSPEFVLFVLCFDDITFNTISQMHLEHIRLISQADFEQGDILLQNVKCTRTRVEYYWTCTPSLPLHIFAGHPEIDLLTYLDADIFFFGDPTPVFIEFGNDSILLVEHRYPPHLQHLEINGIYNVQMMSFRNDQNGMACLKWWRERCLEWCYNRLEDGRMGDQKYLDDWPQRFLGVHVLRHLGAGVAPWNYSQYRFETREGRVFVDRVPLIFYHFHQFRLLTGGQFYLVSSLYTKEIDPPADVYAEYCRATTESIDRVHRVDPAYSHGIDSRVPVILEAFARKHLPRSVKNAIKGVMSLLVSGLLG